jgi:hypothetical protein
MLTTKKDWHYNTTFGFSFWTLFLTCGPIVYYSSRKTAHKFVAKFRSTRRKYKKESTKYAGQGYDGFEMEDGGTNFIKIKNQKEFHCKIKEFSDSGHFPANFKYPKRKGSKQAIIIFLDEWSVC